MGLVADQFEILEFEIKDGFDLGIDFHHRQWVGSDLESAGSGGGREQGGAVYGAAVGAQPAGFVIHNEMSVTDAGGGSASLAKDVTVVSGNGFTVSLVESQDPVVPGDQLTYTVRYGNRSGAAVANAVLSVPIPAGTSYVSASPGAVYTGSAVQWSLGSLAAGASGEQQLTVSVTGSAGDVILADALLADVSGAVPTQRTQVTTEVKATAPYC